jgi:hypothetical protein
MAAGLTPKERSMRECAQEIIAAHVVSVGTGTRDKLIAEYVQASGPDLALMIYDFVTFQYVDGMGPDEAVLGSGRFLFTLGALIEDVANVAGCDSNEVLYPLINSDLKPSESMPPDEQEMQGYLSTAMRAAQTTLAAHFLVRRGHPPIGIQAHANLDDLCVVTRGLAALGALLIACAEEWGLTAEDMIRILLKPVGQILDEIAEQQGRPVHLVLNDYWMRLSAQGAQVDGPT